MTPMNKLRMQRIKSQRDGLKAQLDAYQDAQKNAGIISNIIWAIKKFMDEQRLSRMDAQLMIYKMDERQDEIRAILTEGKEDHQKPIDQEEKTEDKPEKEKSVMESVHEEAIQTVEQTYGKVNPEKADAMKDVLNSMFREAGACTDAKDQIVFLLGEEEKQDSELVKEARYMIEREAREFMPEILEGLTADGLSELIQTNDNHHVMEKLAAEYPGDLPFEELDLNDRIALTEISPEFAEQYRNDPSIRQALNAVENNHEPSEFEKMFGDIEQAQESFVSYEIENER